MESTTPTINEIERALRVVSETLATGQAWFHDGRFHFRLDRPGWSFALTPESAGRLRVEVCLGLRPVDMYWVFAWNLDRLRLLANEALAMVVVCD